MWELLLWRGGDSHQTPICYDFMYTKQGPDTVRLFNTALQDYHESIETYALKGGKGYVYEPYLAIMKWNTGKRLDQEFQYHEWLKHKDIPLDASLLKVLTDCICSIREKFSGPLDLIEAFGTLDD
jgi:hypothetical protein